MNISRHLIVSFLVAAIILFVGLLFWPFIFHNIIEPTAAAVWLLLRILVLSIDQKYFWYASILVAVIFLFRLLPREQSAVQTNSYAHMNATITHIGYWRVLFTYDGQDVRDEKTLKRELIHLLTSLYASKQSASNNFAVYEALQRGEIPLPQHMHTFLFPVELQDSGGPMKRFIQSIRKRARKWIRQRTGQEKADHYRMIDEVLNFLETSLEIKK